MSVCRPYDVCVRYAGDEFIVVLADCSRETAEQRRLELQTRLAEIELEVWPDAMLRLGASAGVAVFPHDGATNEALLASPISGCIATRPRAAPAAAAPHTPTRSSCRRTLSQLRRTLSWLLNIGKFEDLRI